MSKYGDNNKVKIAPELKGTLKCRMCLSKEVPSKWSYHFNNYGTHLHSPCGWWLRVSHNWSWDEPHGKLKSGFDTVSELLCPDCLLEHNENIKELLEL